MSRATHARSGQLARLLVASALCAAGGCSGSSPVTIAGKVSLDGQPLGRGDILFVPQEAPGGPAGGEIVNGTYSVAKGLQPGRYRVEIRQPRPTNRVVQSRYTRDMVRDFEEGIAADANVESTLVVEVKAGVNSADYAVRSRPQR